jgi:hypothetical protein
MMPSLWMLSSKFTSSEKVRQPTLAIGARAVEEKEHLFAGRCASYALFSSSLFVQHLWLVTGDDVYLEFI